MLDSHLYPLGWTDVRNGFLVRYRRGLHARERRQKIQAGRGMDRGPELSSEEVQMPAGP